MFKFKSLIYVNCYTLKIIGGTPEFIYSYLKTMQPYRNTVNLLSYSLFFPGVFFGQTGSTAQQ